MLLWLVRALVFFGWRIAATLTGCWAIQQIIHRESYRVEMMTLIQVAVLIVVVNRIWLPATIDKRENG